MMAVERRKSMREEMQKRMDKESQYYQRRGSLFRSDANAKFFKCKEGPNLLDILTYTSGKFDPIEANSLAFVLRIFKHSGAARDGSDIICIEQTFKDVARREELFGKGAFCPVCKEYRKRIMEGATKEETNPLKYANWPRTIYNIFDRRQPSEGAQVWETSSYLFQQYLEVISKKTVLPGEKVGIENYIPYMDLDEGRSISFKREGMDDKSKFIGIAFEERRSPITDELANSVYVLDSLIAWPTVASAYEAFWGVPLIGDAGPGDEGKRPSKYEVRTEKKKEEPKEEPKKEEDVAEPEVPEMTAEEKEEAELKAKLAALEAKKSGKTVEKEKEKPKEKEKEKPKEEPKETESGGKCPAGHKFGVDIDEKPECEKCDSWKECAKENDRLERASR